MHATLYETMIWPPDQFARRAISCGEIDAMEHLATQLRQAPGRNWKIGYEVLVSPQEMPRHQCSARVVGNNFSRSGQAARRG